MPSGVLLPYEAKLRYDRRDNERRSAFVSDKESSSAPTPEGVKPLSLEELSRKRDLVYGNMLDQLKPWLLEFGNWIFGGLIAFSLVIVATLLTVGPAHIEVVMAIAIFACALPLDVVGLVSVRLIKDMNAVAIDDLMQQAFSHSSFRTGSSQPMVSL